MYVAVLCVQPAQALGRTPDGCWYCSICTFAANTLGSDQKCQICDTPFMSDEDARLKFWCCRDAECGYENREDVPVCDFCGKAC